MPVTGEDWVEEDTALSSLEVVRDLEEVCCSLTSLEERAGEDDVQTKKSHFIRLRSVSEYHTGHSLIFLWLL